MKECKICGETTPSKFYKGERGGQICRKCDNIKNVVRGRNNKKTFVEYKGGKCERCGYHKCLAALDFHHLDPSSKDHNTTDFRYRRKEQVFHELDKCILLCRNCHAEVHAEEFAHYDLLLNKIEALQNERHAKRIRRQAKKALGDCRRGDKPHRRKCIRPSQEELQNLLWKMPTTHIAQQYGVSDKSVEKWAKRYGLKKPTRGYWQRIYKSNHPNHRCE